MREAARRVHRSRRTIMRWLEEGMPSRLVDGQRVILLPDLQAAFVQRLETNATRPRSAAHLEHGTVQRYWTGCRCVQCRSALSVYNRAWYAKRVQETAERRAKAAGWVGEPAIKALLRPYRRRAMRPPEGSDTRESRRTP